MSITTVAIRHALWQARVKFYCETVIERKSEYFTGLSTASRLRYEQKVTASGLQIDPYTIKNWFDSPEVIPSVEWSDMMLYMTATPSQFTRESIKVVLFSLVIYYNSIVGLERNARWWFLYESRMGA